MAVGSVLTFQIGWIEVSLGLSLLFLYFCYTWTSAYTYWKRRNVPFLKPKFPFGNFTDVFLFKKNFLDSWIGLYNDIGNQPFCGVYSIKTPVLVVTDPALIKQLLIKDFSYFTDHGVITSTAHEPLINNLFQLEGDHWKKMRTKLAPAFSGGKMKMMFPISNGCAHQLKLSLENVCNDTGTFEAKDLMSRFSVDIIINSVFGLNATSVNDPHCNFYTTGKQMFERSLKRMFSTVMLFQSARIYSLFKLHFLGYEACEYFGELIKRTMQDREKKNITRNDFVDILVRLKNNLSIDDADMFSYENTDSVKRLEKGAEDIGKSVEGISMTELLAQALSFFFAGFESTSNTLSFCLYELSKRPDLQSKIQEEVDAALERHGGFTYQMMQELPYIDNVINEILRRYTALATLDRICVKPYKIPDTDIIIEKGCKVIIPSYALHHDPRYYPDPFEFDPDRFLEENVKSRPSYTFMPFGEGPRICIGMRFARMEMRIALATIFSEFNCKLNPRTPVPLTIACGEIVTSTRDDILIDVSRRNKFQ